VTFFKNSEICELDECMYLSGMSAKLQKVTISLACPCGTTELPLRRFSRTLIFEYFLKIVEKVQVALKSDKNNG
jgi:hypothetical protein